MGKRKIAKKAVRGKPKALSGLACPYMYPCVSNNLKFQKEHSGF